ncbi:hypothetical protein Taro_004709 [Colocasia esculenta]|uniref:Uncharacterized protein n=1 Tax=Colocasia esculenta TaxID=4460 RepID=A0A843TKV3_COLES|nr:hypothetical protein [Colocasia esculenta]
MEIMLSEEKLAWMVLVPCGSDDGWYGFLRQPLDGLPIGLVAELLGYLEDMGGAGGQHVDPVLAAIDLVCQSSKGHLGTMASMSLGRDLFDGSLSLCTSRERERGSRGENMRMHDKEERQKVDSWMTSSHSGFGPDQARDDGPERPVGPSVAAALVFAVPCGCAGVGNTARLLGHAEAVMMELSRKWRKARRRGEHFDGEGEDGYSLPTSDDFRPLDTHEQMELVSSFESQHARQSRVWKVYSIFQQLRHPWELRYHAYFMDDLDTWIVISADCAAVLACLMAVKGLLRDPVSHPQWLLYSCYMGACLAIFWLYHMMRCFQLSPLTHAVLCQNTKITFIYVAKVPVGHHMASSWTFQWCLAVLVCGALACRVLGRHKKPAWFHVLLQDQLNPTL